ncbi:hypothetical protein QBC34DRAFT_411097 [Podospora aff. communis PSN243]|uniref:Cadherin domain-containing protein n=1 Tax=Podospora aff. communis PSN243 TaxID=3040156 RepID=A0AAV9GFM2_9PEZI|nr:hypothetical protein QBC34DRAFT_411097 [Podospora aff. communis PSN243]
MLDPSGTYKEPLIHDQNPTVGRAILVSTSATPGAPELTFAYDLEGDKVFYNLSPPNIIPDRTMVVTTSDTSKQNACPEIILRSGSQQLSPSGPNVPQSCSSRFDVVLVLCRDCRNLVYSASLCRGR